MFLSQKESFARDFLAFDRGEKGALNKIRGDIKFKKGFRMRWRVNEGFWKGKKGSENRGFGGMK